MVHSSCQISHPLFSEVAIAALDNFQIAVPSTMKTFWRGVASLQIPISKRCYQAHGWLIYRLHIIAHFDELKIGTASSENCPFSPIKRLAPAIPISFEVKSSHPLPTQLTSQAAFKCELSDADFPYHTVFREMPPHFVRVYPFICNESLLKHVQQMLSAKESFIAENYHQLKQIPFYRKAFNL